MSKLKVNFCGINWYVVTGKIFMYYTWTSTTPCMWFVQHWISACDISAADEITRRNMETYSRKTWIKLHECYVTILFEGDIKRSMKRNRLDHIPFCLQETLKAGVYETDDGFNLLLDLDRR